MKILLGLALVGLVVVLLTIRRKRMKNDKLPENLSVKQSRPRTVAPQPVGEMSLIQDEVFLEVTELPLTTTAVPVDTVSESAEIAVAMQKDISSSPLVDKEETLPEDSTLRRHYLSTRRAVKEAITNPYPSDSVLRRHYDGISAIKLNKPVGAGKNESAGRVVEKLRIPEDSMLKRHFLTQLEAEIESELFVRPTDSALRRHYDSQVKAKMQEYLLKEAA